MLAGWFLQLLQANKWLVLGPRSLNNNNNYQIKLALHKQQTVATQSLRKIEEKLASTKSMLALGRLRQCIGLHRIAIAM